MRPTQSWLCSPATSCLPLGQRQHGEVLHGKLEGRLSQIRLAVAKSRMQPCAYVLLRKASGQQLLHRTPRLKGV